jgi:hypothetical protein
LGIGQRLEPWSEVGNNLLLKLSDLSARPLRELENPGTTVPRIEITLDQPRGKEDLEQLGNCSGGHAESGCEGARCHRSPTMGQNEQRIDVAAAGGRGRAPAGRRSDDGSSRPRPSESPPHAASARPSHGGPPRLGDWVHELVGGGSCGDEWQFVHVRAVTDLRQNEIGQVCATDPSTGINTDLAHPVAADSGSIEDPRRSYHGPLQLASLQDREMAFRVGQHVACQRLQEERDDAVLPADGG